MDFSSHSQDADHHPEASPWASSPRPTTTSFPSNALDPRSFGSAIGPGHAQEDIESEEPEADRSEDVDDDGDSAAYEDSPEDLSRRLQSAQLGDDDFDPKPQRAQEQAQRIQPVKTPAVRNVPEYKLVAKITGLERTGRKDPILRFDVQTNLPRFRTNHIRDIRRTHSEFTKLGQHLISSNPEALVPAVPPAFTSAGAGTDEDEARVKASMQRWLNYVCGNGVLMRDDEMIFFVEGDFGYSPVVRLKQPATGVRRKVIKQFAPPPDDTPELANARPIVKLFYLGTMECGQKVDRVVKARKNLGMAESDLGVKLGAIAVQELHPGLANAYRRLGRTIQNVGDYHAAQGTAEATTLGDPFEYHSQDAFIVKETLTNRQILMRELEQAQKNSRSRLQAADRLKIQTSVRREKVDEAIAALDEARSHEDHLSRKTGIVTANLLEDTRRWFARSSADLRQAIREYTLREIESERRALSTLEAVRPDIRNIDSSGGLSRLGREATPAAAQRRSSLAASQGPRGDAWSGVPRQVGSMSRSVMVPSTSGAGDLNGEDERMTQSMEGKTLKDIAEADDDDKVDAKNAASRLATSTF